MSKKDKSGYLVQLYTIYICFYSEFGQEFKFKVIWGRTRPFKVIRGQTWVNLVKKGSIRAVWSNCIQYTYVQTPKLFLFSILFRFSNRRENDSALIVFSQKDTRGSNFWPTKVCEGAESREAYVWRLTFNPPEFLFVINDHVTQFVRKPTFDPLSKWSKTHFWSSSN